MTLFNALGHRPFALLWSGQTLSRLGDSLYQISLAWWVLEKTGSAAAMGAVFIFSFLPMALFVLVGGVAVDRLPRVQVMVWSDALRGILVAVVALLAFTQRLEVSHVYLASLLFGFVNAFFLPAYTALLPETLPPEALPSANSLTSLSVEITGVAGPAIGAFIVSLGGPAAAFALDGLSFLISAICLLPLLQSPLPSSSGPKQASVFADLRQGFGVVRASRWLWLTIVIHTLLNLTGRSPMNVALPFLVKEALHADVSTLGMLYSTFSLGAMIGATWLGRHPAIHRRGVIVYGALIVVGLATLALGLSVTPIGAALTILVLGASLSISNLVWSHILQEHIPRQVLGRVASINLLGSTGLLPVGFGLAGWATDQFGPSLVFVIGGVLTASVAAIGLAQRAIRELD